MEETFLIFLSFSFSSFSFSFNSISFSFNSSSFSFNSFSFFSKFFSLFVKSSSFSFCSLSFKFNFSSNIFNLYKVSLILFSLNRTQTSGIFNKSSLLGLSFEFTVSIQVITRHNSSEYLLLIFSTFPLLILIANII